MLAGFDTTLGKSGEVGGHDDGKVKNPSKVTVSKSVVKKAKKLKAGKSLKLKAKQTGSKVKKRRALSYESSNPAIATVSKKGVVTAKKAGTSVVTVIYKKKTAKKRGFWHDGGSQVT